MTWLITVPEINCPFFNTRSNNINCTEPDNTFHKCLEENCPKKVSEPINTKIDITNTIDVNSFTEFCNSEKGKRIIQEGIEKGML